MICWRRSGTLPEFPSFLLHISKFHPFTTMRLYPHILLLVTIFLPACSSKEESAVKKIVTEWVGRELSVPYDRFTISGESIPIDPAEYDYKIVNYVDSSSCNRCSMKLDMWNMYMSRLNAMDANVGLFTIVKSNDVEEIINIVKSSPFNYPVMIDSIGIFANENNPPNDIKFNTFLLDTDNKVIAIGNPALIPTVGDLYRAIILSDSISDNAMPSVAVDMPSRNIGITHPYETVHTEFYLTNNTDQILTVDTIISSCDCTTAKMRNTRIEPGTIATLTTALTPDTIPGAFLRQILIYFNEIETPSSVQLTGINKPTL